MGDESGQLAPDPVGSAVLASIAMWVGKVSEREAISLALKHFSYENLKEAALKGVKPYAECRIPHHEQSGELAKNIVEAVTKICNDDHPKATFVVASEELFSVPGVESSLTPLDTDSVGARLLGMEASIDALAASLEQMKGLGQSVETLAKVVTGLQGQLKSLPLPPPVPVSQQQVSASYAAVAGRGGSEVEISGADQRKRKRGAPTLGSPQQGTPMRPAPITPPSALFQEALDQSGVPGLSQMLRDQRQKSEEQSGFTLAAGNRRKQRRQAKLLKGASEVEAGGGLPSPFSVFIRNTDPSYGEGDIQKYLEECAAAMPEEDKLKDGLKIIKVDNIPIKRRDGAPPRSKCWKVTVESHCKEHMLKARAYPSSWSARQWYGSRNWQAAEAAGQLSTATSRPLMVQHVAENTGLERREPVNAGTTSPSAHSSSMVVA